nr:LysR family transcriptional regulator [Rhodococcus sp. (in: high G+C Gram-positive bacteria)]
MERRQLEYFLAIIEHGGVTRAAARLHVAQPTISAAIRSLEKELGGQLFERARGRFLLTSAGRALVGPAGRVLREFDYASDGVKEVLGLTGGRLNIGCIPAVGVGWLTGVIARFRAVNKGIRISVYTDTDSQTISEGVREGAFDIGLVVEDTVGAGLVGEGLGTQELRALLPPGTDLGDEPITIEELAGMDLITMHDSAARRWLENQLGQRGIEPTVKVELSSSDSMIPLVTAGAGYALWWAPMDTGSCVLQPIEPSLTRPITLLRREGYPSPTIAAFLAVVGRMVSPADNGHE